MSEHEYGITTSEADVWIHLFPFEHVAFEHHPSETINYIRENNLPLVGPTTGRGYCVPRTATHVRRLDVPIDLVRWCENFPSNTREWNPTQRQAWGDSGEATVEAMIRTHVWCVEGIERGTILRIKDRARQYKGYDFIIRGGERAVKAEAKTETWRTENIFVQQFESYAGNCSMRQNGRLGERAPGAEHLATVVARRHGA